jgi:hypothetical protein
MDRRDVSMIEEKLLRVKNRPEDVVQRFSDLSVIFGTSKESFQSLHLTRSGWSA